MVVLFRCEDGRERTSEGGSVSNFSIIRMKSVWVAQVKCDLGEVGLTGKRIIGLFFEVEGVLFILLCDFTV